MKGAWTRFTEGDLKQAWSKLSPGDQFFIPICGLNILIFSLWRIPRLQATLLKNFCANPVGREPTHIISYLDFPNDYHFDSYFRGPMSFDVIVNIQSLFVFPHIRKHVCVE